jgi:hypothetical protein
VTNLKNKLNKNLKENLTDPQKKVNQTQKPKNPKKLANTKPKVPNKTHKFFL